MVSWRPRPFRRFPPCFHPAELDVDELLALALEAELSALSAGASTELIALPVEPVDPVELLGHPTSCPRL